MYIKTQIWPSFKDLKAKLQGKEIPKPNISKYEAINPIITSLPY